MSNAYSFGAWKDGRQNSKRYVFQLKGIKAGLIVASCLFSLSITKKHSRLSIVLLIVLKKQNVIQLAQASVVATANKGYYQRVVKTFATRNSSRGRNLSKAEPLQLYGAISRKDLRDLETQLLGVLERPASGVPSAKKIAALPAAASQPSDARHYRVLRWSESYTIPKGSKLKAIVAHQVSITADYLSKHNKSKVKPDELPQWKDMISFCKRSAISIKPINRRSYTQL